jgi:DNA repair exonuclease SbcCD ATPase subunit
MNAFGYFLHRCGARLGIGAERHRWAAINRETQILTEAEDLLGRLAWPDVKDIEELSGEYWQIRDLEQQQESLRQQSQEADERNETLKDRLHALEAEAQQRFQSLRDRKSKRMEDALGLMRDIEELKGWKEETKKKFLNHKSKIELMKRLGKAGEQTGSEVEKTELAMARLKEQFSEDLENIKAKTAQIDTVEQEVAALDRELTEAKARLKSDTAELNAEISRLSKRIADLSAKIGALENTKSGFYFTVGHFLSDNIYTRDPLIFRVLRKYRQLISRIIHYRRSIAYNQRLTRPTKQ